MFLLIVVTYARDQVPAVGDIVVYLTKYSPGFGEDL
jgi:hypothetical protein